MKYFFSWVAFFAVFTLCFPLCFFIIKGFSDNDNVKGKPRDIKVYFAQEDVIKSMNSEEYILGVLMAEMPAEFELEALKAQSVAARTYLYEKIESKNTPAEHKGGVVCTDSSHCQAYISVDDAKKRWGKNASFYYNKCKKAVKMTKDVVAYYQNKPIKAVFHAFATGKTENAEDVWGGKVDYLKSVDSPGDLDAPGFSSVYKLKKDEFRNIMEKQFGCDFKNSFIGDISYTAAGSVKTIKIGDKVITGGKVRNALGLRSACFKISEENENLVFEVTGYGHGVGMSQYGANYFAKKGMKYEDILKKYYSGIQLKTIE